MCTSESSLTTKTFYMTEEEYNKASEANKKILYKYIASIENSATSKSQYTIDYNTKQHK